MSTVVGLVLAAGAARRMGRPKQLLPLGGRALLQHVVDAAAASALGDVVIVLGHEADAIEAALRLPARARVVRNPDHAEGRHPEWVTPVAMAGEPPADVDDDEDYRRACEAFDTDTATTGG